MSTYAGAGDIAELYTSLSKRLEQIVRIDLVQAPDPVVEDACQFAWGRLIRDPDRIQRDTALPWLARTAVHEAFKLLRRERFCLPLELVDEPSLARQTPGAAEVVELRERLRAIDQLPERQRRLLWLHGLGLSYAEIAAHTGCSRRTVERQLLRARRALREAAG